MIASIRGNANIVDTLLKIDSALCVVSSKVITRVKAGGRTLHSHKCYCTQNASTPFHIAARRGHTDVLRVLLAHHPKMTDPANNMGPYRSNAKPSAIQCLFTFRHQVKHLYTWRVLR